MSTHGEITVPEFLKLETVHFVITSSNLIILIEPLETIC
jgi:hypothetical protein